MTTQGAPRSPTPVEALHRFVESYLDDVHTSLPAKFLDYDPKTQTATVQILVNRLVETIEGGELEEEFPAIPNVPVRFPRTNKYYITFPIEADDPCQLVFASRSLDAWNESDGKKTVSPNNFDRHELIDAVAVPGLATKANALPETDLDGMQLGRIGGAIIHIGDDGIVNIGEKAAAEFVALAQKTIDILAAAKAYNTAIEAIINGAAIPEAGMGAPSAFQAALKAAIALTSYPTDTDVAATKAKAT